MTPTPSPRTAERATAPSPQAIARALTLPVNGYPPIEGREISLDGSHVTIWEANTYAHKPGELHLELGPSGATYDVVLTLTSIRPHPKEDAS